MPRQGSHEDYWLTLPLFVTIWQPHAFATILAEHGFALEFAPGRDFTGDTCDSISPLQPAWSDEQPPSREPLGPRAPSSPSEPFDVARPWFESTRYKPRANGSSAPFTSRAAHYGRAVSTEEGAASSQS